MSRLLKIVLLTLSLLAPPALVAGTASPAGAACVPDSGFTVVGRTAGWSRTSVYSEWIAGPSTITRTVSKSTADTWGGSVGLKVSLGAVLAKAETTFSVNYSHTTTTGTSFGYQVKIPAKRTGRMQRLHRADQVKIKQTTMEPTCTSKTSYHYVVLPRAANSPGNYCTIRDLTPAMGKFKQYCTNSD